MDDQTAQFIRINIEALLSFGIGAFVATVGAAWALLFQLVFKPLNALKTEISKANAELHKLAIKQMEIESQYNGRMNIFEVTIRTGEQRLATLEHRHESLKLNVESKLQSHEQRFAVMDASQRKSTLQS